MTNNETKTVRMLHEAIDSSKQHNIMRQVSGWKVQISLTRGSAAERERSQAEFYISSWSTCRSPVLENGFHLSLGEEMCFIDKEKCII